MSETAETYEPRVFKRPVTELRRQIAQLNLADLATAVARECIEDWDRGRLGAVASVPLTRACEAYVAKRSEIEAGQ